MEFLSKSVNETMSIASNLAKELKGGEVFLLNGELGAGKTVFCKGIAVGLGIKELVTSPTFTIVREYKGGRLKLNHFDMYRIEDADELFELGIDEYFNEKAVCVIEWNKLDRISGKIYRVNIKRVDDDVRSIEIL